MADKFNFRYQFLLIEFGTELLRRTFDEKLGTSLVNFLKIHPKHQNKIQELIKKRIITETQKLLLPPVCTNPTTSSFDITLLYVLLRNIVGLKKINDQVWKNPSKNDTSVEADIARLRICRNKLSHSGTVYAPEKQLKQDWLDLSSILLSLNSKLSDKYPNLQYEIDKTLNKSTDDELSGRYNETLILWNKIDSIFEGKIEEIRGSIHNVEKSNERVEEKISSMHRKLFELTKQVENTTDDTQSQFFELRWMISELERKIDNFIPNGVHNNAMEEMNTQSYTTGNVTEPKFIMFDLQTTGLFDPVEPHITQISAVEPKSGFKFDNYVRPKKAITPEAQKLTGIVHSSGKLYVRGVQVPAVGIRKAIGNFLQWLNKFPNCVLIAHCGNRFDFPLLMLTLQRIGVLTRFYRRVSGFIDSLAIFKDKFPGMRPYKQIDLVRSVLGERYPYKAYNALEHAKALARLVECANMTNEERMGYSNPPETFARA